MHRAGWLSGLAALTAFLAAGQAQTDYSKVEIKTTQGQRQLLHARRLRRHYRRAGWP